MINEMKADQAIKIYLAILFDKLPYGYRYIYFVVPRNNPRTWARGWVNKFRAVTML